MGKDKHKIIIEFNGLPGCGKSAVAHNLIERLSKQEVQVLSCYDIPEGIEQRFFHALYDGSIPFCYKMAKFIRSYKSSNWSFLYSLRFAWYFYQRYVHFIKSSSSQVLVIEQGLIQLLLSYSFSDVIIDKSLIKRIIRDIQKSVFGEALLLINCEIDVNTSLERITQRGKNDGSRLDKILKSSDSSLVNIFKIQEDNLDIIWSTISESEYEGVIHLDMNRTIDENTSFLVGCICPKL